MTRKLLINLGAAAFGLVVSMAPAAAENLLAASDGKSLPQGSSGPGSRPSMAVEAKAAYFHPTDSKFRKIYSSRGIYGAEYQFQAWRSLYGWASADYYSSWGRSIGLRDRTHIYFVPLALGLKYLHSFNRVDLYVGVGALGTYLHIRDHSPYAIPTSCKWGFGGIAKVGCTVNLPKSFFLDFFSDYSYTKVDFHNTHGHKIQRHRVDLSGCAVGGAIGYRFGGKTKK